MSEQPSTVTAIAAPSSDVPTLEATIQQKRLALSLVSTCHTLNHLQYSITSVIFPVMMGELGFVDPKNRRTQTVECIENGDVLTITYEKLLELYFQNPEFGYYFLRLTTERLMQNISRLEVVNEAKTKDIVRLEGLLADRKVASQ